MYYRIFWFLTRLYSFLVVKIWNLLIGCWHQQYLDDTKPLVTIKEILVTAVNQICTYYSILPQMIPVIWILESYFLSNSKTIISFCPLWEEFFPGHSNLSTAIFYFYEGWNTLPMQRYTFQTKWNLIISITMGVNMRGTIPRLTCEEIAPLCFLSITKKLWSISSISFSWL